MPLYPKQGTETWFYIRLLDVLGREISQQVFDKQVVVQEFRLDIGNLSQGVYWVEVADSKDKQIRKIVKE